MVVPVYAPQVTACNVQDVFILKNVCQEHMYEIWKGYQKCRKRQTVSLFSGPPEGVKDIAMGAAVIILLGENCDRVNDDASKQPPLLSLSNPGGPDARLGSKRDEERLERACAKIGTSKTVANSK